ncbi:MAG: hypothetical protein HYY76_12135 [Acidobacteria bacterium]|nr:hypothetical protein [Acidobacteriota bacterium]
MREYGFNFKDRKGNEPVMMEAAFARGFDRTLRAGGTTVERFVFPVPRGTRELILRATLTYQYFVMPPGSAQEQMQASIADRIASASPEQQRHILDVEVPARMDAMHTLASTYPDLVMADASTRLR